jgi:hypothetical protein
MSRGGVAVGTATARRLELLLSWLRPDSSGLGNATARHMVI